MVLAKVMDMDPKGDRTTLLLAPPARGGGEALSFPQSPRFPPVDEHIVVPEITRDEMIRGRKVIAQPALEPHGDAHADVGFLIRAHVREGYRTSVDLLTRVSEGSNFATDLSVRKDGTDPKTGHRFLEELSFEIVNEQSARIVHEKAEELTARGVRRVFAIFVKRGEIMEWSRTKGAFVALDKDGGLEDPCFLRPITVKALLDIAVAETEVIQALERKGNAGLEAIKERAERKGLLEGERKGILKGQREGRIEAQREMLSRLLRLRFGELPADALARLDAADAEMLDRWADQVIVAKSLDEVFGGE